MAKDFAKILDTRNLKAVKLRFDVRAEHKIHEELKALASQLPKLQERCKCGSYDHLFCNDRKPETWNPYQSWME